MNTNKTLERMVTDRLASDAAGYDSDRALDDALASTSRMRPYPQWLALMKEPPMRIPSRVVVGSPTFRLVSILALTLALLVAVAGAVVAGASLLPSQAPRLAPFGPAANGSLIYGLKGDIFLADADGGNSRPLITGDTIDNSPWFSHDGTRFGFARGPDATATLMVAKADGTGATEFPIHGDWWAEFMPSDTRMVATRTVDGRKVLSVFDVDGSGPIIDVDLGDIEPTGWVMPRPPDGEELVFTGYPHPGLMDLGLFAVRADGTQLRTIGAISTIESAEYSGTTRTPGGTSLSFQSPVLSPDGSTIAYGNWEPAKAGGPLDTHLHMRDLVTGAELPVPFDPDNTGGGGPHFSPDGRMVVYEGTLPGLTYAPVDGSQPGRSMGPPFSYLDRQGFEFSPDGKKVILSLVGMNIVIDVATGEFTVHKDIPTSPSWQRLAP